ncbi:pilus assembly protein TadG-related protein [Roseococcus sp.]|uniref:pilus assembly protein TadG-related protein n=1 Tax=Roseococcus sp. TaxID=2109646 RepID=UPI003BABA5BA
MIGRPARRADGEEGAIAPLVAVLLASLCGFAGLAVDMGMLQYQKRALQTSVDAAALSAARAPAQAQTIASTILNTNGRASDTRTIAIGTYQDNPALAATQRFALGGTTPNAVRVVAQRDVALGLTRVLGGASTATVHATAIAQHRALAAFSIGSSTANLNNGTLNQVLSGLLGGNVNLDAVSYNGLLGANAKLFSFSDRLATALGVSAGSYQSLLNAQATAGQVLNAAASVLGTSTGSSISGANTSAVSTTLSILAQAANNPQRFRVADLLGLDIHQARGVGTVDESPYANLGLNAFNLVNAAASLGGANAATLPVGINVPGVASATTQVMIVQPMQSSGTSQQALGPVGTVVGTAQVRTLLSVRLLPLPTGEVITLPLLVEVAPAQATLSSVSCQGQPGTDSQIGIRATTGVARAQIGLLTPAQFGSSGTTTFGTLARAPLVNVNLSVLGLTVGVTVYAQASASVGAGSANLNFTPADIAAGTTRSVSSTGLTSTLVSSLGQSLVLTPELNLSLIPPLLLGAVNGLLGPLVSAVLGTVTDALTPVLATLDPVVDQVLAGVGVQVGTATIRATGVRCGVPSLVL